MRRRAGLLVSAETWPGTPQVQGGTHGEELQDMLHLRMGRQPQCREPVQNGDVCDYLLALRTVLPVDCIACPHATGMVYTKAGR